MDIFELIASYYSVMALCCYVAFFPPSPVVLGTFSGKSLEPLSDLRQSILSLISLTRSPVAEGASREVWASDLAAISTVSGRSTFFWVIMSVVTSLEILWSVISLRVRALSPLMIA